MILTLLQRVARLGRKLWVRVVAVSLLSVLAAGSSWLIGPMVPDTARSWVSVETVNRLLDIMANSMLAVTIFSLSVSVAIHQSVSSQWTPRAHRLHLRDTRAQTVLATFVGSYIYALLSIILIDSAGFDDRGVVVLFGMTLVVVLLVVLTLLGWILHLQGLGSLNDTARRMEIAAAKAVARLLAEPSLGAQPLGPQTPIPEAAHALRSEQSGHVQYLYPDALQAAAAKCDARLYLLVRVGDFVHAGQTIARWTCESEDLTHALREGIEIGQDRSPDQDPVFAVGMLAEIAAKALSPGINDDGTAVDVMGRLASVLWAPEGQTEAPRLDRVWLPPTGAGEIAEQAFEPIARDAAGSVAVMIPLLRHLAALAHHPISDIAAAARDIGRRAHDRAEATIGFRGDLEMLAAHTPDVIGKSGAD